MQLRPSMSATEEARSGPIVAAIALSESDDVVIRAITHLARRLGTAVRPVHAIPQPVGRSPEQTHREETTAREAVVDRFANEGAKGITIFPPVVRAMEPSELVCLTAEADGAQLVLTGGGEQSTVRRFLIGSVAERILRRSRVPVWVARGAMPAQVSKIVCAVDLSPPSRTGLAAAIRMARSFAADLRVVTVIPKERPLLVSGRALADFETRVDATWQADFDALLNDFDLDGLSLEIDVRAGKAAPEILESSHDADLIVIGSGGRRAGPWALGGTTEKVLRASWCSVLTAHHEAPAPAETTPPLV